MDILVGNLDKSELSKIYNYCASLPDCEEKTLLMRLYYSYDEYTQIGTIKECLENKEWMSFSINDIKRNFNSIVKFCRNEVNDLRKQYEKDEVVKPHKKRGRPRKE